VKPSDLALFRAYGRPAIIGAGTVLAALSTPDVDADMYRGVLRKLCREAPAVQLTRGPRDSAPVVSPNGAMVVFLRAGRTGPSQLYAMALDGGEPFQLAEHPLGASSVVFSPDGRTIAYLAAVPEPGRYGTVAADSDADRATSSGTSSAASSGTSSSASDGRQYRPPVDDGDCAGSGTGPSAEEEPPRRITSLSYRTDGRGFTGDRREQIFVLELIGPDGAALPDSTPRQVTGENVAIGRPAFTPDGREIVYTRTVSVDSVRSEIAAVAADRAEPGLGRAIVTSAGDATAPVVVGDTLFYVGAEFDGVDFAGRTSGLWAVPYSGGTPRRLTDPETVVRARRERLGLADRDVGYRLFLRGVLRGLGPGGSAREVAAGVRRPHRDPAAHRPFGTGLAMPDRAGPAPVRGAEVPWTPGRDASLPR